MAKTKFLSSRGVESWYLESPGKLLDRIRFKDGVLHGITVEIHSDTSIGKPVFYSNGVNVTDDILNSVGDINNLTEEDKTYIKIKYDIDLGS